MSSNADDQNLIMIRCASAGDIEYTSRSSFTMPTFASGAFVAMAWTISAAHPFADIFLPFTRPRVIAVSTTGGNASIT
jgi:hypothetical protein